MTLPLIHTLQMADASQRRRIIRLVKYRNQESAAVQEVMDAILKGPGMDYSRRKMTELTAEALALLEPFSASPAKAALQDLVEFTIQRKR